MKIPKLTNLSLFICILVFSASGLTAQKFDPPATYEPQSGADLEIRISTNLNESAVTRITLELDSRPLADLRSYVQNSLRTFLSVHLSSPLMCRLKRADASVFKSGVSCTAAVPSDMVLTLEGYSLRILYTDNQGNAKSNIVGVKLLDLQNAVHAPGDEKADSDEDANYYISGNMTGAHKKKTAFTTQIKIQPYHIYLNRGRLVITPFYFKLNASTAPDADPDEMEIGTNFRNVLTRLPGIGGAYFDNGVKLESEKDLENTNFMYDGRVTFLPAGKSYKAARFFMNPFIGTELGKNLRSPLAAAEGDGIARILAGADIRVTFLKAEKPWINWTTSYTRRWLLSNELRYRTDDDDNLILVEFGKRPRDYFESKFSFAVGKFSDAFIAYDWGAVPPSYKKMDHRFRVGFEFKAKKVFE